MKRVLVKKGSKGRVFTFDAATKRYEGFKKFFTVERDMTFNYQLPATEGSDGLLVVDPTRAEIYRYSNQHPMFDALGHELLSIAMKQGRNGRAALVTVKNGKFNLITIPKDDVSIVY